ncbi:MAG: hypothetical protein M9918_24055, partial [Anaerolineae bacterium]|nr:hypothetical protein [Anaerolineae bacterium]
AWLAINSQQKTQVEVEARSTAQAEAVAEANAKSTAQVESERSANLAATREAEALSAQGVALAEADLRATAEAIALEERDEAETQFQLTRSRELAGLAKEVLETDPELAILLAKEAMSIVYTAEAENFLHHALLTSRLRQRFNSGNPNALMGPAAISPDGSHVASLGVSGFMPGDDQIVYVWSSSSGELLHQLPGKGYDLAFYPGVIFSSDGAQLVNLGSEESFTLWFWSVASGEKVDSLQLPLPSANVSEYVLSPDWDMVAVGYTDGSASLWDTESGERLIELEGHNGRVGLGFSGDSRRLVSADAETVKVWDTVTGEESLSFRHDGFFLSSAEPTLSADGRYLALYTNWAEVGIWDLEAVSADPEEPVRLSTLTGHTYALFSSEFSADATKIATGARDQTARIWDPYTGEEMMVLASGTSNVITAAFNPEATMLVTGGQDGTVKIWDLTTTGTEELYSIPLPNSSESIIALSPDEMHLAVGSGSGNSSGDITIWDVSSKQLLMILKGHTSSIYDIEYSPDGRQIATSSADGTAIIWEASTGEPLFTLDGHGERLSGIGSGVYGVDFSPEGDRLATSGSDGTVRFWNTQTGEEQLVINDTSGLFDVRFSPNGALLATASDEPDATAVIWDAATGERLITLPQSHFDRVWSLDFSPDGKLLATAGGDSTVKLWQFDLDERSASLVATLLGHTRSVTRVAFSPDGQSIASVASELKLWDVSVLSEGDPSANILTTPRFSLSGKGNPIFSADGDSLVYLSQNQPAVQFVTLSVDELVALAEERLTRVFTEEECLFYRIESCGVSDG